jgi:hypothetical protein
MVPETKEPLVHGNRYGVECEVSPGKWIPIGSYMEDYRAIDEAKQFSDIKPTRAVDNHKLDKDRNPKIIWPKK